MSVAAGRAELRSWVAATGIRTEVFATGAPPYAIVLRDVIDLEHLVRGAVDVTYVIRLVAGKADQDAAAIGLDQMVDGMLQLLRRPEVPYAPVEVRRDGIRTLQGTDYLTADVLARRMIAVPDPD